MYRFDFLHYAYTKMTLLLVILIEIHTRTRTLHTSKPMLYAIGCIAVKVRLVLKTELILQIRFSNI